MNVAREIHFALLKLMEGEELHSIASSWCKLFSVEQESTEYYLMLSAMMAKFDSLQKQINISCVDDVERRLYCGAADRLLPFVRPSSANGLQVMSLRGAQSDIDLIYLSGRVLEEYLIPEISKVTIDALIDEINGLLASVHACEPPLSARLRELMESSLRSALFALQSYDVLGLDGFNRVFGTVIFGVMRASETAGKQSPGQLTLLKKFMQTFKKIGVVIALAHAAVGGAAEMIESGGKIVDFLTGPQEEGDPNFSNGDGGISKSEGNDIV
jgi:hypothetical protein